MRWAFHEFTHYTGDDAMFEVTTEDDYSVLEAPTLGAALDQVAPLTGPLARLDDSDSPYGGVFAPKRLAARYFKLNEQWLINTPCVLLAAESVLDLDFDRMETY